MSFGYAWLDLVLFIFNVGMYTYCTDERMILVIA